MSCSPLPITCKFSNQLVQWEKKVFSGFFHALEPTFLFSFESEISPFVVLAESQPKVIFHNCKLHWCFPEFEDKRLTKCVLWLLRSQPAFEASGQGPEPTGKSATGQEVLTAQRHAQTAVQDQRNLQSSRALNDGFLKKKKKPLWFQQFKILLVPQIFMERHLWHCTT